MPNLRTKTIAFLLIIVSYELSFSQLTLEDIFLNRKYEPKTIDEVSFLKKNARYIVLENKKKGQEIATYNSLAQKKDSFLLSKIWADKDLPVPDFTSVEISNTDKYFLLKSNEEKMYRRAGSADYYITDGKNNISKAGKYKISFPVFSPNDRKIAYVRDNDLFYFNIENQTEQQITSDGKWNYIINGKSDWVYEEEFSLTSAFAWNQDGNKIAYLKFDESNVKEYAYPTYYGQTYPNSFSYKYPKAGEQSSIVSAHYYDLKKQKNYKINLSNYSYEYIPKIISANNSIYFMMLNRHQDTLKIVSYDLKTKQSELIFTDVSKQYVEVPKCLFVLKDNSFITTSERDGYNHLYLFDEYGKLLKQLSKGNFEITDVYGVDEINKQIYYQSNEDNVTEKKLWKLNYDNLEKKQISLKNGKNTAVFSTDFSYFIQTFSDSKTTPKFSIESASNTIFLEENKSLQDSLSDIAKKEFITINVDGNELYAWIIKPKNIDSTKKYPLLIFVYGGPSEQQVLNEWSRSRDLFYHYLAEQGYAVACVDNRGTDGRGAEFKKCTFLNLGKLETDDQIAAARYFGNLEYINKDRIGIFGWSYGGYMALLSILQKNTPFKTAVAVAPVTNWKFYDNIYTERYMHTPSENEKGYEQFNPINLAKNLNGNLLIIHGTADDNVHFQNSVEMVNALNEAGKTYQFYMYPDKAHSINSSKSRYDVFKKIAEYLNQHL